MMSRYNLTKESSNFLERSIITVATLGLFDLGNETTVTVKDAGSGKQSTVTASSYSKAKDKAVDDLRKSR